SPRCYIGQEIPLSNRCRAGDKAPPAACDSLPVGCGAMARPSTVHRCASCGATSPRWAGRCPDCGDWNCLEPVVGSPVQERASAMVQPVMEVEESGARAVPSGLGEVDRVLAGGIVPGSVTLLYGEPGVGKSTLTLQVLRTVAAGGRSSLLVSAEESAVQVRG